MNVDHVKSEVIFWLVTLIKQKKKIKIEN